MAYNEKLAQRVREMLADVPNVEEKKMFRGITFMVNGKMCVSVGDDEVMCRIDPAQHDEAAEQNDVREMMRSGKALKGFIFAGPAATKTKKDLQRWVDMSLGYNSQAKATKKKK